MFRFLVVIVAVTQVTLIAGAREPIRAEKPSQENHSPAVAFAEGDVDRLRKLATADAKLKPRLQATLERLKRLRNDESRLSFDPKRARLAETFKLPRPGLSCRFDARGRYLFAGAMGNNLHRIDLATAKRDQLPGHESWVRRFDLNRDASLLVSGSYAGRLFWWNRSDPGEIKISPGPTPVPKIARKVDAHNGYVRGVDISPDGTLIATGGNDNLVRLWSVDTGKLVREMRGHDRHVYNVKFDPTGKSLVSGDLMGVLKQWDVATGKHIRDLDAKVLSKYDKTFRADCGGIRGMAFSPSGKYLLVAGISKVTNAFAGIGEPTGVLFDFKTGKKLRVMTAAKKFRGALWGVAWQPSGQWFVGVGGSNSGGMWFWKPESAKSFHFVKLRSCGYDVAMHPDGLRIAVALYGKSVALYDMANAPTKRKPTTKRRRRSK